MRKSRLPAIVTALGLLLLYVPLVALVAYSFLPAPGMAPGSDTSLGFTLQWYVKALSDVQVLETARQSVWVSVISTLISTVLGTAGALALQRADFSGKRTLDAVAHLPLVMPEIVLGLSLLVWFVFLRITLGTLSIVLAHVTFTVSYVLITVKARLEGFDHALEEAAQDLGASPWQVFSRITLPLIWPGILSGALIAFTLSFDDFLVTFFTAGPGSDTLPLKIYSMIKHGLSPELNALSSLLLAVTLVPVLISFGRLGRTRLGD